MVMTFTPPVGLAAAVAVLVVVNLLNNRLARSAYLPMSLVTTALLLAVFRLTGLTWADAGLGRDELARGARWGLALATLVAVGYLAGALLPATRRVFLDRRVEHAGVGAAAYQTLVRIPLGTVMLEEVAFRGVLYGLVSDAYGITWATAVSCSLFGLWHVLPARDLPELNPVAGRGGPVRGPAAQRQSAGADRPALGHQRPGLSDGFPRHPVAMTGRARLAPRVSAAPARLLYRCAMTDVDREAERGLLLVPIRAALLWTVGGAVALLIVITGAAFLALGLPGVEQKRQLTIADLFDLLKLTFAITGGLGAVVALVMAYRRQRVAEAANGLAEAANRLAEAAQEHRRKVDEATQAHQERTASDARLDAAERRVTELYATAA